MIAGTGTDTIAGIETEAIMKAETGETTIMIAEIGAANIIIAETILADSVSGLQLFKGTEYITI